MTSTTRREEYSSNIIRTLHPTTTTSTTTSTNNLNENIDYLLDDLQHSISGTSQYLQSKNVQHLSPANTTTYIKERSVSPGLHNENKVYKTSSYQYSTSSVGGSGGNATVDINTSYDTNQNVNQLDTLLQDLKNERDLSTREKDYSLLSSHMVSGLEASRLSPNLSGTRSPILSGRKSPNVNTTRLIEDRVSIKRDVVFDPLTSSSPKWNTSTLTPSERSHHFEKKIETTSARDVSFEDNIESRKTPTLSRSEKYVESRTVPYFESTVTNHGNLPDDLKNVPLSEDILPVPGTKVTTTVRTYTYEIPAEPATQTTTTKKLLYKREVNANEIGGSPTLSSYPVERDLPPSVVYKTETYRTTTGGDSDVGHVPTIKSTKTILHKKNVNESTSSNTYIDSRNIKNEYVTEQTPLIENNIHYITDVSRDVIDSSRPPAVPPQPATGGPGVPPVTYYYKHHETTNTTNTLYGPPGTGGQPSGPHEQYYPTPQQPSRPYPTEPSSKTIAYNSYSSSTRTTTGGGDREPLLHPAPFPTDGTEPITQIDSPPKRVDDLMASLGNETISSRHTDTDTQIKRKREIETGVATAERPPPSKNVAGPPVYYPPGREMFMKKEESSAGYRAGGQYARASGKYEYEAESKSKSKSKSGATMVPVCLPLCCAMPCSIM